MSRVMSDGIGDGLDVVVRNASGQLVANDRLVILRRLSVRVIPLMLVVPVSVFLLQLVRWGLDLEQGWFSWGAVAILTCDNS